MYPLQEIQKSVPTRVHVESCGINLKSMTIAKYDTRPIQLGSIVYCTSDKILDLKGRLKAVYLNIQIRIFYNPII
jgi:hypothetical protein